MSDNNTVNLEMTTVDISMLISGMPYQRDVDERKVKDLIAKWDPILLDAPTVSLRDGNFYLVDGQHRVIALRRIYGNQIKIPCKIYYGLTYQQEAELCYKLDQSRAHLSTAQAVNALVESESDPEIMEICIFRLSEQKKPGFAPSAASFLSRQREKHGTVKAVP